ncbi:MAG: ATP-binding protein [Phycisphaerales bacterium]|nr:ATP-binding protein [Phycisphaerales bacterium]
MNGAPKNTPAHARTQVLRDQRTDIERVQDDLSSLLASAGYDDAARFAIRLAMEEALVNAFRHGNRGEAGREVTLEWRISAELAEFIVQDQGEGFDPGAVPDPTLDENLEIPSGRGIMLMRAYMHEVEYLPPGNRIRLRYMRAGRASA